MAKLFYVFLTVILISVMTFTSCGEPEPTPASVPTPVTPPPETPEAVPVPEPTPATEPSPEPNAPGLTIYVGSTYKRLKQQRMSPTGTPHS